MLSLYEYEHTLFYLYTSILVVNGLRRLSSNCFCALQSRYVGYYEIMKTKFNRQLPPPKSLRIKSIRIHSIAGKNPEGTPLFYWYLFEPDVLLLRVTKVWVKVTAAILK